MTTPEAEVEKAWFDGFFLGIFATVLSGCLIGFAVAIGHDLGVERERAINKAAAEIAATARSAAK